MIELRWKETLSKIEHNGTRPIVKTVLQYRQEVHKTVYPTQNALSKEFAPNGYQTSEWSEWRDVTTIQEITN